MKPLYSLTAGVAFDAAYETRHKKHFFFFLTFSEFFSSSFFQIYFFLILSTLYIKFCFVSFKELKLFVLGSALCFFNIIQ